MSTIEQAPLSSASSADAAPSVLAPRTWKTPIILGVFALVALLVFVVFGHRGTATFTFTASLGGAVQLPSLPLPAREFGAFVAVVTLFMAAGSVALAWRRMRVPLWYVTVFTVLIAAAFLAWATVGHTIPFTAMLVQGLALSTPLIFGALGGVISERVGVVNVAIEGQMLAGAFLSAVVASITHSAIVGLVAAMVAGLLVALVLGVFAIRYAVNQVIVGVVLNVFVLALTTFLYQTVLLNNPDTLNHAPLLDVISIPGLSAIPILGPLLFSQSLIVYLMYVALAAVTIGLYRTRWGLRVRAVGEHPLAADTVGINVARTRYLNVMLAGAIAGLGGTFFTVGGIGSFTQNTTSGAGFIALAAVIFGKWDPIRATLAAMLFGFSNELQYLLTQLGSPVPSQFLLMVPYLVTVFAVAGVVGRVRGPAASGKPYVKN